MSRQKRKPGEKRKGDKRKTMFTTGWHRDPRFRFLPLPAKELYRVLWDLARDNMREVLPPRFNAVVLADEVGSGVTPGDVAEALKLLAEPQDGARRALIELRPGEGIRVLGIKAIHAALEAWTDEPPVTGSTDESPEADSGRPTVKGSPPVQPTQNALQNAPKPNGRNRIQSIRDSTVPDSTGQDSTGQDTPAPCDARASPAAAAGLDCPADLVAYELFQADRKLCRAENWAMLKASWERLGVDVEHQLARAHAFAVGKKAQGTPYSNMVRFLRNWMTRAQDDRAKFGGKRVSSSAAKRRVVDE